MAVVTVLGLPSRHTEEFEQFQQDKKASSRIVECVYDPEWLTFVPSHDKSSWDAGSPEFSATERGQGWRKGARVVSAVERLRQCASGRR